MKIYEDLNLRDFKGWGGAKDTIDTILKADKEMEFEQLIDELYPDGLSSIELNDLLWFDDEWIFEMLEIIEEEEEEEEEEEGWFKGYEDIDVNL